MTTVDPRSLPSSAQKVMTMTSTYDHRVIQGAESGAFLRRIDQAAPGRGRQLRLRLRGRRRDPERRCRAWAKVTAAEPVPAAPAPAAGAVADASLLQAVQAATS